MPCYGLNPQLFALGCFENRGFEHSFSFLPQICGVHVSERCDFQYHLRFFSQRKAQEGKFVFFLCVTFSFLTVLTSALSV